MVRTNLKGGNNQIASVPQQVEIYRSIRKLNILVQRMSILNNQHRPGNGTKRKEMKYEAYGKEFETVKEAKKYVESLPYYGEAISKGGLLQTIWDRDGDEVCSRQMVVNGIGANRTVSVGSWFNY